MGGPRTPQILIYIIYKECSTRESSGGGGETWEKGKKRTYKRGGGEPPLSLSKWLPANRRASSMVNKHFLKRLNGCASI
jgi:hypothetical protein